MLHDMYKVEGYCQENYEKTFSNFLHRTIWDSNILDGFNADEIEVMEKRLCQDDAFRDKIVQLVGEKIYEKLFNK